MNIATLGGGPAGLYVSLLLKKADPSREVVVLERNPPDATYGWGVVFSGRTLSEFREADPKSAAYIERELVVWDAIDVHLCGRKVRVGGQAFSGVSRKRLLEILQARCREVGVEMRFDTEVDPDDLDGFELVIAADGANSQTRERHKADFGATVREGRARYIWFGSELLIEGFSFFFRQSEHGLFQAHAYPFDGTTSTFIVECREETWRRAGLDEASEEESITFCQELFADDLRGKGLLSNRSTWLTFPTVKTKRWRNGRHVLVGDSAHTAHFSIGSGTKLAMEDSIALMTALERHDAQESALDDYEAERRPRVERFQEAAAQSQAYFEVADRYLDMPPEQFVFNLLTRSGRVTYDALRLQDDRFVTVVDRGLQRAASAHGDGERPKGIAPPSAFAPLKLEALRLRNRVAFAASPSDSGREGLPGEGDARMLARAAAAGVALVFPEPVAVMPEGRVTERSPGIYATAHVDAWQRAVEMVHAGGALAGVRLTHAGRRGAVRPRTRGLDRPLGDEAWPLWSASPLAYGRRGRTPREMGAAEMEVALREFARGAARAAEAGFDLLLVDMGHGYLLSSFLSPLTNVRTDEYGGGLEARARFPMKVVESVRAAWPAERPLGIRLSASDWEPGGLQVGEAVEVARAALERGCELVEVVAGHTTPDSRPRYEQYELVSYSDRIRNEAGIATMATGAITSLGDVNTIVGAGRADLCLLAGGDVGGRG